MNSIKLPETLVFEILSYRRDGWIYDKKKCANMLMIGKRLKMMNCDISSYLLATPLHLYRGVLIHITTNQMQLYNILLELKTYTNGYSMYHRLIRTCLKKMMYYMTRLGAFLNTRDARIMRKLKQLKDKLVSFGISKLYEKYCSV